MALIQQGTSIKCRTREEIEVFKEIATAEGHLWANGDRLSHNHEGDVSELSFQVGYGGRSFPRDISKSRLNWNEGSTLTVVEAADLFRNQLISMKIRRTKS